MISLRILTSLLPLAHLSQAAPVSQMNPPAFYIVTTSQKNNQSPSATLADVSATSLFDPYYQPNYLLRTIEAGYGSLPNFTLTDGRLHTTANGPHGIGTFIFNSTDVADGTELQFLAEPQTASGSLALHEGYLLTVGGEDEGWSLCRGDLGQRVIVWKGADASCVKTYLHAVLDAPY